MSRRPRIIAASGAIALAAGVLISGPAASAAPTVRAATAAESSAGYIVLAKQGASAAALATQLTAAGATVSSVNEAVGMVTVSRAGAGFLAVARANAAVAGAAANGVVGHVPKPVKVDKQVLKENVGAAAKGGSWSGKPGQGGDPLDAKLWDMQMMNVPEAQAITLGDRRVRVGIIDTGVDASHPDIAPNFDAALSRNFTVDDPALGDLCNYADCVDPANVDDNEHGTHVAGTIAASLNGMGMSGVAPNVTIVNVRAGQDSGYFLLGPTVDALTYSADAGIDVVNMSFYVDPWLYNCQGGAPEDSPEEAAEQNLIIEAMNRALNYAHSKNVTMVAALGNDHDNIDHPRIDRSSPDFPWSDWHARTIDPTQCFDLPTQGAHVIGVSSVGPSGRKADYSNWTSELGSGSIEVSAPGGFFRDGFGTDRYRTSENMILSAAPLNVLQANGYVDADGAITPDGEGAGILKDCTAKPAKGASACGYYQWLQGTSMASPHAAGVAALVVSRYGKVHAGQKSMAPDEVRDILMRTAVDHACPAGGVQTYTQEGRPAAFTAQCVGTTEFNGIYGDGIVNAYNAVAR